MKNKSQYLIPNPYYLLPISRWLLCLSLALSVLFCTQKVQAGVFVKTNSTANLNTAAAWTNNAVPGASDIAQWDSTAATATTNVLGGSLSWSGIAILNPGATVMITTNSGGNTLTLGASGIDLSGASADLIMSNNVTLPDDTVQTWNVPAGRTLSLQGAFTRFGGAVMTIVNSGTINIAGGAASSGLFYSLVNNATDVGALDASKNVSTIASVKTYTSPAVGGVTTAAYNDVINGNTGTSDDVYLNTSSDYFNVIRFNVPQPNRNYWSWNAYKGQTELGTGTDTILVTTNVGACDVIFRATGSGGISMGWRQTSGCELIVDQENTAGSIYFYNGFSQKNALAGNMLTKRGAGRAVFNTSLVHTGPTRILEGELMLNGGSASSSVFTVNSGATLSGIGNVTGSATNNGTIWAGTNGLGVLTISNLTLNAGSSLKFYSTAAPMTNTTPLLLTTNPVVNGAVNVYIAAGKGVVGQYPLVKSTSGAFSSVAFNNFTLAVLPLRTSGYLSNNTTASTIDLVVTNVNEPLTWATGSGTWDTNGASIWQDPSGNVTSYQEASGVGDSVLFEDTLSGSSPITVTLNNTLAPDSTAFNNSAKTYTLSGNGSVAGNGSFTKSGSGALTLATTNFFTGGINLNGGLVSFNTISNLGAGAITFGGGTLQYNGNTDDISTRPVTLGAGGGTIDTAGQTIYYAGPIGNNGAGGLTITGAGTLTLAGTNKYFGNTIIANSTLALGYNSYISNSAAIIVNSGAVLDAASSGVGLALSTPVSQILAGVGSVNGEVTVSAGTTVTPATNGVYGTLAFGNDLTISGGTLAMDVSTTNHDLIAVTGSVTINSGSLLVLNASVPLTNGVYTLITYGGALTGGAGSVGNLTVLYSQPGKAATLDGSTAGEINLIIADTASDVITWAGAGNTWDLAASQNWFLGGSMPWAYTNGDFVTFDNTGVAQPTVSLQASVTPSSITVSNDAANYDFIDGTGSGGGKIAGATGIVKTGAGTLILETANVNTGSTVISNGTVQVGNGLGGDLGPGNVTNNGALVFGQGDGNTHVVSGQISGPGTVTQQGLTTVVLAANNTYSGLTTISSGTLQIGNGGATGTLGANVVADNGVLSFNRTGSLAVPNQISGTGALSVNGGATITLAASNNFTGSATVNAGKLIEGQATALAGQGALVVQAAGTNDLNGYDLTVAWLKSTLNAGGRIVNNAGTGTNVLTIVGGSADSSIVIADNDGTGGKIQLVMNGTGEQILRGASTYSGGTVINSGSLEARSQNAAFGTGNIILNGGQLHNYTATLTNVIQVVSNSQIYVDGNSYMNDPIDGSSNLTVMAAGGGTGGVTISWGAADQLAGYSGQFLCNVDATTYGRFWRWAMGANGVNGSATAGWDLEGNFTMNALNLGYTIYLGSLASASTLTSVNGNSTTYIVGDLNASTTYSGNVYGTGSFVKSGAGTLTLDNSYTFYGSTVVSNGVLALTGNAAPTNSSTIAIHSGAVMDVSGLIESFDGVTFQTNVLTLSGDTTNQTLTGSGTLVGSVVAAANSTINPGDGIGTLTVTTNITLGGTLIMELNRTNSPATNDMLAASTIEMGGTLTVTNRGPDLHTGDTFQLFSVPATGAFAVTNLPATTANGSITYVWTNKLAIDGTIQVLVGAPNLTLITNSPAITNFSLSGANVVISGTNGQPNGTCFLLESTNLAAPRAQWKTVATNVLGGNNYTFTGTNVVTAGSAQQFFMLSSTNYNP